jgi:BirA family biotin operon repressor/biotin-[acetyl-CoA-carboxylase] ligase
MPGNVHVSVLLRPALPLQRVPLVALASAVAVAEALGAPYGIKWPNDILAPDGRKVAGLLAEADTAGGHVAWIVVGVGINVVAAPDLPTATCTADVDGVPRDPVALSESVAAGILRWSDTLVCGGLGVLARWRELSCTLGRQVRVGEVTGTAVDIDPDGALRVLTSDGERRIVAGDVSLIGSV